MTTTTIQIKLPTSTIELLELKLKKEGLSKDWFFTQLAFKYISDELDTADLREIKGLEQRLRLIETRISALEGDRQLAELANADVLTNKEQYALTKLLSRKELTASLLYNLNRSKFKDVEDAKQILETLEEKGFAIIINTNKGCKAKLSGLGYSAIHDAHVMRMIKAIS